ncbi:hypothetical protein AZI86_12520 [Bdellovibrio bacteriovorus]|uniref:DUF4423 domain-containing protein n=1 Tax=Bdellovibrio bacteriovorus TaxID=959 RepID=A0A150WIQ3_BDEBC|nr:TIGR02147 family protein [Bdellovibrio bacteriovorus]KYG63648.1 hypothetical protein AZI86_12520 [Bdellovibrio bacteriovorus]
MANIFEFQDYKVYLKKLVKESKSRGFSTRLAEAAGCQISYLSITLSGKPHLLPEHVYGISELLGLQDEEREYFLMLLDYQRANTPAYRNFVLKKIQQKQEAWKDLKNRVQGKALANTEPDPHLQHYYSNYLYAALHIAVSIPKLQTLSELSKYFGFPEKLLQTYLQQLAQMGLVENIKNKWIWKSGDLHLPKESPWMQPHHNNWRLQALAELPLRRPESLHYSVIQSLSREDLERLRFQVVRWIQDFKTISGPSKPEELVCFNLDFFTLSKTGDQ